MMGTRFVMIFIGLTMAVLMDAFVISKNKRNPKTPQEIAKESTMLDAKAARTFFSKLRK